MTYKITSPHSISLAFGDFTVSPGANEIRGEVPPTVLQGMRDAGMTVEVTSKGTARPVAPPPAKPPEAAADGSEGAESTAPKGRAARGSSREG